MREISVELEDVSFGYWRHPVFDHLSWTISGPSVIGLLGPNGAGKTTLMRLIATSITPLAGHVRYNGTSVTEYRHLRMLREELGYLPQELGYYPAFTVAEFVTYVAWLRGMAKTEDHHIQDALQAVEIADLADRKLRSLSGGQLRRVGIAQALVNRPRLLLLDEPTAGLDPGQRLEFRQLLRGLSESTLVVVSTHLVEDVAAACDFVAVLREGSLVFEGPPTTLQDNGRGMNLDGATDIEKGYIAALSTDDVSDL